MTANRLRWRFWSIVCKLPRTCPANAHRLIIEGHSRNPMQDRMCEPERGACWCGKRRDDAQ
jgi:hypothetical protein